MPKNFIGWIVAIAVVPRHSLVHLSPTNFITEHPPKFYYRPGFEAKLIRMFPVSISLVLIVVVNAGFGFDEKGCWKEMDKHSIVPLGVCRDELI